MEGQNNSGVVPSLSKDALGFIGNQVCITDQRQDQTRLGNGNPKQPLVMHPCSKLITFDMPCSGPKCNRKSSLGCMIYMKKYNFFCCPGLRLMSHFKTLGINEQAWDQYSRCSLVIPGNITGSQVARCLRERVYFNTVYTHMCGDTPYAKVRKYAHIHTQRETHTQRSKREIRSF